MSETILLLTLLFLLIQGASPSAAFCSCCRLPRGSCLRCVLLYLLLRLDAFLVVHVSIVQDSANSDHRRSASSATWGVRGIMPKVMMVTSMACSCRKKNPQVGTGEAIQKSVLVWRVAARWPREDRRSQHHSAAVTRAPIEVGLSLVA
eukprot:6214301-Pleurochrysis_carterae.AAC.3